MVPSTLNISQSTLDRFGEVKLGGHQVAGIDLLSIILNRNALHFFVVIYFLSIWGSIYYKWFKGVGSELRTHSNPQGLMELASSESFPGDLVEVRSEVTRGGARGLFDRSCHSLPRPVLRNIPL